LTGLTRLIRSLALMTVVKSLGRHSGRFFSHRRAGFISLPGQVGGFPAEYTIGCQPSTTTKLHVLLGKDIHLQARPDNSHGRGAKNTGDVDKSSFSRRLFSGFGCRWLLCSRGCPLSNRRLRFDFCRGRGWAAVSLSQLPYRIPVAFVPLVYGVGRRNLLQAFGNQLSPYTTIASQELNYSTRGAYLLRRRLSDLHLLRNTFA
jgi:hypothetical protein